MKENLKFTRSVVFKNLNEKITNADKNNIETTIVPVDKPISQGSNNKSKDQNNTEIIIKPVDFILPSGIKQVQPSSSTTDISSPFVQLSESDDEDDGMFIGFKESEINEAERLLKPKRGRKMLIRTGTPGRPRKFKQIDTAMFEGENEEQ
ncbi:hypothetical protein HCN44_009924 [Aphidius gifuensis]|uniref:Uncharacterized protein n=1 Tax=Aphidius gifuensis TaxID=684658 RepID=A0A834XYT7_APHGI|nr:hypothetical protein HCN44_009924 [Aphidius gifuensis]